MEFESREICRDLLDQSVVDKSKSRVDKIVQKLRFLMFQGVEKSEKQCIYEREHRKNAAQCKCNI